MILENKQTNCECWPGMGRMTTRSDTRRSSSLGTSLPRWRISRNLWPGTSRGSWPCLPSESWLRIARSWSSSGEVSGWSDSQPAHVISIIKTRKTNCDISDNHATHLDLATAQPDIVHVRDHHQRVLQGLPSPLHHRGLWCGQEGFYRSDIGHKVGTGGRWWTRVRLL